MRTFFVSDIHGNFAAFNTLLNYVKFSPSTDHLVIGGDMINRGPKSAQVLQWARYYMEKYPETIHVIAGNHEEMMVWFVNDFLEMRRNGIR
ncbi:metallophosphoesterase [Virgibacillus byunsanensis]|uniref:Metallophosphoesterase n=1 Tax=Virgibacillus byunsanensis TaxID=570945 RepID=A0ABW3LK02_9BACI